MDSKCDSYQEKIAAWALDDLSDADRRELEAHLDICPRCRLEKEGFAQTVGLLTSAEDAPAPRRFFISPDPPPVSPWRLFPQMPFPWRAAFTGVFVLTLLLSGAALSQFHVRSGSEGLSMGFGRGDFNTAALREEFLRAAAEDSQKNQRQLMEEVRDEIARLQAGENSRAQKLEEILVKLDSRIDGRVERSEEQVRQDTAMMIAVLYQELARQWKHDMELVNLRLELAQLSESLNMRQTEKTLGTLLQYVNMNY